MLRNLLDTSVSMEHKISQSLLTLADKTFLLHTYIRWFLLLLDYWIQMRNYDP